MNVGSARGQFKLDGLKQSIADLKKLRDILVASSLSYKKHRKEQAAVVDNMKKSSTQFKKAARQAKFFKGTIRNLNGEIKRLKRASTSAAKSASRMAKAMSKSNINKSLARLGTINKSIARIKRLNSTWVKLTNKLKSAKASIVGLRGSIKRLTTTQKTNEKVTKTWLSRFGSVAAGFWIAYRAINAVEFAITELTQTWARGAKLVDEYRESVATTAGMLGLMSQGLNNFAERYTKFSEVMKGTMEESIRLAPKYRLSLEDIGNAYKEFAQFGVVITRDITEPTLNSIAMIKEIAVSTGGSARQIRQEIQALFNGQTRVTDQFGRFLKRFPALKEAIFGVAKANTTNTEKWRMVIEAMYDFNIAIMDSNKTLQNQASIIGNNLAIISSKAAFTSGIYDKWVVTMEKFNSQLFDDQGKLRSVGKVIYGYFFRIWQIVSKLIGLMTLLGRTVGKLYDWVTSIIAPFRTWASSVFRVVIGLHLVKFAFIAILGIATKLWAIFKVLFFIPALVKFVVSFRALLLIMSKMAAQVVILVAGFRAWAAIFAGLGAALGVLSVSFGQFFTNLITNVKTAGHNFKELGKAITTWDYKPDFRDMVDVNTFTDLGKKAGDAFFQAYDDQIAKFDNDIKKRVSELGAVFVKLFDKITDTFVGTGLGSELVALKAELTELMTFDPIKFPEMKEYLDDMVGITVEAKEGLADINAELKKMREFFSAEFSTMFTDIFSGEIATFNELWDRTLDGVVTSFEKAMADLTTAYFDKFLKHILADKTLEQLVGAITGYFTGPALGANAVGGYGTSTYDLDYGGATNAFANGGMITEPVFGVGAVSGKSYSFAEQGPEQVLPNGASISGATAPPIVQVNVINKTSGDVDAKQGKIEFDGKRYIIETILTDIDKGGPLRSVFGGNR